VAQVFISCGQRPDERDVAARIEEALRNSGFDVYVAIQAQSTEDVNSGIIGQLKRSDYYIFIDFARELVGEDHRGSLFTNQELAIAYMLGFEHVLFFQQSGLKLEGLLRYMGANATPFRTFDELPKLVTSAVAERKWSTSYSRHLAAVRPRWEGPIPYGQINGKFLYVDIENRRNDLPAFEAVARLLSFQRNGGPAQPSSIRSHLKVTGALLSFEQTIWPNDHGAFDLLAVDSGDPTLVYLNTALDVAPLPPLLHGAGNYDLNYAVIARDFPMLRFTIRLQLSGDLAATEASIVGSENAG
jgi:hypothetical protein